MSASNYQFWQTVAQGSMINANPCELVELTKDTRFPANTGFYFVLGGSQNYGVFFPNGLTVLEDAGFLYATTADPIIVFDETSGRGKATIRQEIPGMPIMMPCDNSAKGLTILDDKGNTSAGLLILPGTGLGVQPPKATAMPFSTPVPTMAPTNPQKQTVTTPAGAGVITFGNWDVVPSFLEA